MWDTRSWNMIGPIYVSTLVHTFLLKKWLKAQFMKSVIFLLNVIKHNTRFYNIMYNFFYSFQSKAYIKYFVIYS